MNFFIIRTNVLFCLTKNYTYDILTIEEGYYMKDINAIVDTTLLTVGTVYSLDNLDHILGIIIMVLNIVWLLTKLVVKVVNTIKSRGNLDELDDEVEGIVDILEENLDKRNQEEVNEDGQDS